ncbi:FabD/lysophospholipase-like protein [Lentithecium fluviatile CBS 122367]|uniref:FabD/lysophospholipase-like protein n=1 Tax=Lentithecium fluviatile CBS 122367 TaxID=1168545 RepID=A0A6G1ISR1_9PLEO|nr:FabD/lysophospholipase-like protein [Lentithecium fluviatile CBS 122367]
MLYADCEGLEGGEQTPIAAQCAATSNEILLECVDRYTPKPITWADSGRQAVVRSLYPRLLYSFSDVIVFALDNHKKFEQVVAELVEWGHQVVEKACNQSVLPHAVIALNKAPTHSDDTARWDSVETTKQLLSSVHITLKKNDKLQQKVAFWSSRKVTINTVEDLLKCYYSSITAIRIPNHQPPKLLENQITKLYDIIADKCATSQRKRKDERMQLNAVDLHLYLRNAFDHFATQADKPFDFVKASFEINPSSASLGLASGISRLAEVVQKCLGYPDGLTVWNRILPFVASCMFLSAYRLNVPGRGNPDGILRHFWGDCKDAIREFYDKKLRCEYRSNTIQGCVNVKNAHLKGHQSDGSGAIEGGVWACSRSHHEFETDVKKQLKTEVQRIALEYRRIHSGENSEDDELRKAYRCHTELVRQLQSHLKGNSSLFRSHFICLSCLMEAPEHTLPCGHTLCTPCISSAGRALGSGFFEAENCPLDFVAAQDSPPKLPTPYRAAVKPTQAGVRILTLDGGGVRGIVELEILRAIELELDDKVPIQAFFDLIVGTSTGGIISLGVGHEGWTVQDCTEKFKRLAKEAFKPHRFGKVSQIAKGTKYRTSPFEDALRGAFSPDAILFGDGKVASAVRTKTAVVTATPTGPVTLLSNYNRRVSESERYRFLRGADQSEEIKTFESARATSAAPWYWEVYSHGASGQVYLDGGIYHNNPIRIADSEQKSIWPERKNCHPDVLLSIGTGFHNITSPSAIPRNLSSAGALALVKTGWNTGSKLLEEQLDSERIWKDWIDTRMPPPEHLNRYRRINLPLDFAPQMDQVDEIEKYEEHVRRHLRHIHHEIQGIAHHLIASCFYFRFEKENLHWKNGSWTCKGHIECRLPPGDQISKGFGELLQKLSQSIRSERVKGMNRTLPGLCFCVTEMHLNRNDVHELTQDVIDEMKDSGRFGMPPFSITITSEAAETNIFMLLHSGEGGQIPIGGFPRNLLKDFPETYHKKKPPENYDKNPILEIFQKRFFSLMMPLKFTDDPSRKRDRAGNLLEPPRRIEEIGESSPVSTASDPDMSGERSGDERAAKRLRKG